MRKHKILLIDDDLLALKGIGISLERTGYDVTMTDSGERAFELLEKSAFDLVLTDLVMEPLDGIDILIKTKELNPETKVIIITGYGDMESKNNAFRFGVDDFLQKPIEMEKLILCVKYCLEKSEGKKKIYLAEKNEQGLRSLFAELSVM